MISVSFAKRAKSARPASEKSDFDDSESEDEGDIENLLQEIDPE